MNARLNQLSKSRSAKDKVKKTKGDCAPSFLRPPPFVLLVSPLDFGDWMLVRSVRSNELHGLALRYALQKPSGISGAPAETPLHSAAL